MDPAEAVDELYAVPLSDFVATRTRLVSAAKEAGATDLAAELGSLRKPTLAAWLLNRVVRDEPAVVAELNDLGERMRSAQAKGDGGALAAARPDRHDRVEDLTAAASMVAAAHGVTFGPAAVEAISATAVAALADADSARALASGRLLRPLSYAGFGEVELDDAVAVPLALVAPWAEDTAREDESTLADDTAERAHEAELAAARDDLRESERALSTARLQQSEAEHALELAARQVVELKNAVAAATATVEQIETRPTA